MNRKKFIASSLVLAGSSFLKVNANDSITSSISIPPYLKDGDLIGITSPAGYVTREQIIPAATQIQQWGFKIRAGYTIGKRNFTFGGTDSERLADLQLMLDDPNVKAILCARGGYGSVRLVDQLNWDQFRKTPKWVIGFSDITVLHSHIQKILELLPFILKCVIVFQMFGVRLRKCKRPPYCPFKKLLEENRCPMRLPALHLTNLVRRMGYWLAEI